METLRRESLISPSMALQQIEPAEVARVQEGGHFVLLWEGTFGPVLKGEYRGRLVALHELRDPTEPRVELFRQQVHLFSRLEELRRAEEPNEAICEFVGWFDVDPAQNITPTIVLEYMPFNLHQVIYNLRDHNLTMPMLKSIMLNVARGLQYLHNAFQGRTSVYLPGSLQSQAVMLTEDYQAKLSAFNLDPLLFQEQDGLHPNLDGQEDVLSLASVFYEALYGIVPNLDGALPAIANLPQDFQYLILNCWSHGLHDSYLCCSFLKILAIVLPLRH
jgi:serine/threonine protein kinase